MDPKNQDKVLDKDGNEQSTDNQDGSGTQPDGGAGNSSGGHEQ